MDNEQRKALSEKLAQLREIYLARLPDALAAVQAFGDGLCGGERDRASLEALSQHLHKLAGSGGSFGCAELSAAARVLEQRVKHWLNGDLTSLDAASRRALAEDLAALHATAADAGPVPNYTAAPSAETALGKTLRI